MQFTRDHIIKIREDLGLSKSEMARQLDVSPQAYGKYELGMSNPSIKTAHQIIKVCMKHGIMIDLDYIYPLSRR